MEIANVLVGLGGDRGNTVPKYGVTAAEIAVIRSIHGEDSVFDIEPIGEVSRPSRVERSRLVAVYGRAMDGNQNSIVEKLYPGAAAPLFETLDSLELPDDFYKTATRVARKPKVAAVVEEMPEGLSKKDQATWKKDQAAKVAAAQVAALEQEVEDDGIGDMPDNVLG
jgi:hypothetical protein